MTHIIHIRKLSLIKDITDNKISFDALEYALDPPFFIKKEFNLVDLIGLTSPDTMQYPNI